MFEIIEEVLPEDPDNNVFMSVRSTLRKRANITFDHEETNLTISCQVSDHQLGDAISSSMSVLVECKFAVSEGQRITVCDVQTPRRPSC